jgi:hypothetical protein
LKVVQVRVCFQERLLEHVFGIVVVLGDLLSHPEDTPVVVFDQLGKGFDISGFCPCD